MKFFGDSLVRGFGVPEDKSWVYLVSKNSFNYGANGATTADVLSVIRMVKLSKYTFVMAGLNDFFMNYSFDFTRDNFSEIAKAIKAQNSTLILGIPPMPTYFAVSCGWVGDSVFQNVQIKLNMLKDFFKDMDNVIIIDFNKIFDGIENPEDYFIDGVHPNTVLHSLMADYFLKNLENKL